MSPKVALDNCVWHALQGPQAGLAEPVADPDGGRRPGPPGALRYDPEVSVFAGVDEVDDEVWAALAELAGPGGFTALFRDEVPPPPEGWTEILRLPGLQLIAGDLQPVPPIDAVELGPDDVEDMLELVALTEPGPFLPRTIEMGTYVGVREGGRLLAMAGQRFRIPGWTEISAVCTHPDARKRGLGTALTLWVAREIRRAGDEAFLHVVEENVNARRLYESIGFSVRRPVVAVAAQWGEPAPA